MQVTCSPFISVFLSSIIFLSTKGGACKKALGSTVVGERQKISCGVSEVFCSLCLQELSKAFEDDARDNRRTQLMLSANVAAFRSNIDTAYEVSKISP